MSLKDLFNEDANLQSFEHLTKADISGSVESYDFTVAVKERNERFFPFEGFSNPATFAKFGLAEKYYEDAIRRVYNTYPYDGSLREKVLWEVSSSLIDVYLLDNGYPRRTGYVTFSTASLVATNMYSGYGAAGSASYEFISFKGGPHAGTGDGLHYNQWTDSTIYRKDANIYDLNQNRENNLKIDGNDGNTVEFWLKKEAFDNAATEKETILDVFVTGALSSSINYGRLRVEMTGTATGSPFLITYMSATTGFARESIGNSLTTASVADNTWHHYAFRFNNSDAQVQTDFFVDGKHNARILTGSTVDYVSGNLVGTLASLGQSPSGTVMAKAQKGYAKLSGSLDEVRYWKKARTSKKIQQYWFDQVGGGTNTDPANTDLGVYYKFNEGITGETAIDSIALDYSGRLSNGTWTGYSRLFSRSTGSAILESSASAIEFHDPIIYSTHPAVVNFLNTQKLAGREYDYTNVNSIISHVPSWMLEANETDENDSNQNVLLNLLQIIASQFDNTALLIEKLPSLSEPKYYTSGTFPAPFNKKALESRGFVTPDIFINLDLLEQFDNRNDELKFEQRMDQVKSTIYQNIYNNLIYLYKTKGTEKSLRNLIRCFGTDDEILKFNIYTQNNVFKIEDNNKFVTKTAQFANFNQIANGDATVYQFTASGDPNATSFLTMGPGVVGDDVPAFSTGTPFTLEADVILPHRVSIADYSTVLASAEGKIQNDYPLIVSSSLFGLHDVTSVENDGTWHADDRANFQVYTVKENNDKFSATAKFVLTGTSVLDSIFPLESPFFEDVYDDQKWTISVSVYPEKQGVSQVGGTTGADFNVTDAPDQSEYIIRFYGCNYISDIKYQSFEVSATLPSPSNIWGGAYWWARENKRIYAGAHRTNFTGSTLRFSDTKISAVKAWYAKIPTSSIDEHNKKVGNYGPPAPTKNAFLYEESYNAVNIPELGTLALYWDFATVTGSDTSGQFFVEDITSGSSGDNRYGDFSIGVSRRHPGRGDFFGASSADVVQNLARGTLQQQVPEVLLDSNLTNILNLDDEYLRPNNRNTRPTTYHFSLEKNLFQSISEEMLHMFDSILYLNTLIGNPTNVWRGEYKELGKLRELFFEKVGNDYDFDKYVEYFKYIDYAIGSYVEKLIPLSLSTFRPGVATVVENFVLDRNKYANKFPIIKDKMPEKIEAPALGVNELLYNWKYGHAPSSSAGPVTPESESCLWWKERAARTGSLTIVSADVNVNDDKQVILDSIVNETNAPGPTLTKTSSVGTEMYQGSTYVLRRLAKPYKVLGALSPSYRGGSNFYQNKQWDLFKAEIAGPGNNGNHAVGILRHSDAYPGDDSGQLSFFSASFKDCNDGLDLGKKRKWKPAAWILSLMSPPGGFPFSGIPNYFVGKADLLFPFGLYSSSAEGGYHDFITTTFGMSGVDLTNLHDDIYGPSYEVPMQGPFTEKYVGGNQWRHIDLNYSGSGLKGPLDTQTTRPEGWQLDIDGPGLATAKLAIQTPGPVTLGAGDPHRPIAKRTREPLAKRPVNIANIRQTTGSSPTKIGNYEHDYDIVQTAGRTINNRFFVDEEGIEVAPQTSILFFSPSPGGGAPLLDFTVPDRSISGSNKFVFANRFSAPGGPETLSPGFMDAEAAEFSVYNALPFRNLSVRLPLQELLTDHCKQFGYFSDMQNFMNYQAAAMGAFSGIGYVPPYPGTSGSVSALSYAGTASFHKVNRNSLRSPYKCYPPGTCAITGTWSNSIHTAFAGTPQQYLSSSEQPGGPTNFNADAFTVSTWLKADSVATDFQVFLMHGIGDFSAGQSRRWSFQLGGDKLSASVLDYQPGTAEPNAKKYGVPTPFPINEWHHVAFTFNSSSQALKIYVDGSPQPTTFAAGNDDPVNFGLVTSSIIAGGWANTAPHPTDYWLTGSLDETSFWNTDLNAAEVLEIFSSSCGAPATSPLDGGPTNLNIHSRRDNLVSWWRMGDAPGDVDTAGLVGGIKDIAAGLSAGGNDLSVPVATANPSFSQVNFLTGGAYILPATVYVGCEDKVFDNAYIQHQIPRTDLQYAWITASVIEGYTGSALYGFEEPDYSLASMASTDLTFCSASDFGSYTTSPRTWGGTFASKALSGFVPTDFAGINSNIYEPLTSYTNILGYPDGTALEAVCEQSYLNNDVPAIGKIGFIDSPWLDSTYVVFNGITPQYLSSSEQPAAVEGVGLLADDFTVSTWINVGNVNLESQVILQHGSPTGPAGPGGNSRRWDMYLDDGEDLSVRVFYYLPGAIGVVDRKHYEANELALIPNKWYQVGFTFNSSSQDLTLYINGLSQSVTKFVDAPVDFGLVTSSILVGGYADSLISPVPDDNWFTGSLDEASFWNTDLNKAEMLEIFNSCGGSNGAPTDLNTHSRGSNLVSWWRMGDAPGDDITAGTIGGIKDVAAGPAAGGWDLNVPLSTFNPTTSSIDSLRVGELTGLTPQIFNSLILHRQGPYGWPTWKQIRGGEHPIARYQHNNNIIQYIDYLQTYGTIIFPNGQGGFFGMPSILGIRKKIVSVTEPPLSSKYKPLIFVTPSHSPDKLNQSTMLAAYGNKLVKFTDHRSDFIALDEKLDTSDKQTYDTYRAFQVLFAKSSYNTSADSFINVSYGETIYPKEQYTYLKGTRKRENFINTFWRDERTDRSVTNQVNSLSAAFGGGTPALIPLASMWKLDAHLEFTTTVAYMTSGSTNFGADGAGELQNNYCLFRNSLAPGMTPLITSGAFPQGAPYRAGCAGTPLPRAASEYARKMPLVTLASAITGTANTGARSGSFRASASFPGFIGHCATESLQTSVATYMSESSWPPFTGFIAPSSGTAFAEKTPPYYVYDTILCGDTLWTAPEESPLNYKPFYDSYDDYVEDLFRVAKDSTIVPEFRITEHIDRFYAKENPNIFFDTDGSTWFTGSLKDNQLLTLTGSSYLPASDNYDEFLKRYTFSDFLKYFKIVQEDYEDARELGSALLDIENTQVPLQSTRFKIVCEAALKFLPYDGFYPAERCVQLGALFSQSSDVSFVGASGEANFRTAVQPFFAPGIIYNSIKSGLAVDYPVYTGSAGGQGHSGDALPRTASYGVPINTGPGGAPLGTAAGFMTNTLIWEGQYDGTPFDIRIPFEALYNIENYKIDILDWEPACRTHIDSTASVKIGNKFRAGMHNFLAESVNTFLQGGGVTQIKSAKFDKRVSGKAIVTVDGEIGRPTKRTYSMDIILKNSTNIVNMEDYNAALDQLTGSFLDPPHFFGRWPLSCSLNINTPSVTMYSRAITGYSIDPLLYGSSFGPPTTAYTSRTISAPSAVAKFGCSGSDWYKLASFEPYTPPYYDGFAAVRISVNLEPGEITLEQLVKQFTYEYHRLPTFNANGTQLGEWPGLCQAGTCTVRSENHAWINAMHINSSINIGTGSDAPIIFKGKTSAGDYEQLIFSPKWECPILDFTNKNPVAPFFGDMKTGAAKGMWHQYGERPLLDQGGAVISSEGITLEVQGGTGADGDLAALLDIAPVSKPLGVLGEYTKTQYQIKKNTLGEAVVAIPFKVGLNGLTSFYNILPQAINGEPPVEGNAPGAAVLKGARDLFRDETGKVLDYANLLPPTLKEYLIKNKISENEMGPFANIVPAVYALLQKMHKYVIPPHLDFLYNDTVPPFVMYMWEFEVDLKIEDLQNIWQNIAPPLVQENGNVSRAMMRAESEIIRHVMPTTPDQNWAGKYGADPGLSFGPKHDFFYDQFDESKTRWAVFKVKKRARNNYNSIIGRSTAEPWMIRNDLDATIAQDYPYSFNWPHDFYSLVELIKIDTSTTFSKRVGDIQES